MARRGRGTTDAGAARTEGNQMVAAGAAIGVMGAAGAALGAACPLCVVAAPGLVGYGLYRRWRASKAEAEAADDAPAATTRRLSDEL